MTLDESLRMNDGDIDLDWVASKVYSAVVSDSCDRRGLRHQTAAPGLVPISVPERLVGWVRTVRAAPVSNPPTRPYGTEIDFVDSLLPGDVVLADTSGSDDAFWGELFSVAAIGRGARGAVIDGLVRDRQKIAEAGFPVYARGTRPADSFGRLSVTEQDEDLVFMGVAAQRGDFIVADDDGIVIVPKDEVQSILESAVRKASVEDDARQLLLAGGKLADVWEEYGVL
jgi:4-hydroxy-4-methyl-2-oxoglutarate aldolase